MLVAVAEESSSEIGWEAEKQEMLLFGFSPNLRNLWWRDSGFLRLLVSVCLLHDIEMINGITRICFNLSTILINTYLKNNLNKKQYIYIYIYRTYKLIFLWRHSANTEVVDINTFPATIALAVDWVFDWFVYSCNAPATLAKPLGWCILVSSPWAIAASTHISASYKSLPSFHGRLDGQFPEA